MSLVFYTFMIGIGATAIMDLWALFLKMAFNISGLNLSMVGRWIGHIPKGKFIHQGIGKSPAIAKEAIIGWTAHYVSGVIFAAALVLIWGVSWVENPSLIPVLIVGVATVVFPFFLMQPCFGMGFAASKLPNSSIIRLKSLMAHSIFGLGLYISAVLTNKILETI